MAVIVFLGIFTVYQNKNVQSIAVLNNNNN